MAKKLEESMRPEREDISEEPMHMRRSPPLQEAKVKKPSKARAHTDSGSFERHERAVAGIKAEVKRESKTKEPMKKMRKKPQDDFSHLKL
jgi:hypothetical protein